MKQLLQPLNSGESRVVDVPAPVAQPGCVVVRVVASLVSAGTERAVVEFSKKNLLQKARARPDLVHQALQKAKREGILPTLETLWSRMDRPMALGYSCAGTIVAVGAGVTEFQVGEPVACAGGGHAVHAEIVVVPQNLIVRIPTAGGRAEASDFESGAFTTVGAIALQGIRLAEVKLGETAAVIGLGLVGQLTVQILKAAGCRVVGIDLHPSRAKLALQLGADAAFTTKEELLTAILGFSAGAGADAVLITADTPTNTPVELAGAGARDRAVVVAVGAVGMDIPRKVYYEKELDFRISRSYGPGRYDPRYEKQGNDYPIAYVRWTENRNMQAFVSLVAEGKVKVTPLITHRFPIEQGTNAYDLISGKIAEPHLGVVIGYSGPVETSTRIELGDETARAGRDRKASSPNAAHRTVAASLVGAGNFANTVLLPCLKRLKEVGLRGVGAATGLSARHCGDKFGFRFCTTDENEIMNDSGTDAVFIATRHHLHSQQVVSALNAGKHVFVEKPLALTETELSEVIDALSRHSSQILMVGYNRRFAPLAADLKLFFTDIGEPITVHYRVNAGYIPANHWTQDPAQGGGRILGEACHFIDFAGWLIGHTPAAISTQALPDLGRYCQDNVAITLKYPDGSLGVITYLANGDRSLGKERVEVHGGGRSGVLDDFRRLELVSDGRSRKKSSWLRQDKGHQKECEVFIASVRSGGPPPISPRELVNTTRATFAAVESLRCGCSVGVSDLEH